MSTSTAMLEEQVATRPKLASLERVKKSYTLAKQSIDVLDDLSVDIQEGEFLALMGPSGSGKSTLLNLLGGIDRTTSGSIQIGDARIDQMNEAALTDWRAVNVGFVFQHYYLLPILTAEKNVELPLMLRKMSRNERKKRVEAALKLVDLADRAKHKPSELSGGQQQRVGIARAVVTNPQILLCDEPTGDLDRESGDGILELLSALHKEQGKTIVMVTHDPRAASFADRTLYMVNGRLAEER